MATTNRWQDAAAKTTGKPKDSTSTSKQTKPRKVLSHIVTKRAKSGGFIHEHHHTQPEHHPVEPHVSADDDDMQQHMLDFIGSGAPPSGDTSDTTGELSAAAQSVPQAPAPAAAPAPGA